MSPQFHTLHLNDSPFRVVESGRKKIEFRLYDENRQKIKVGDTITFEHIDDAFRYVTIQVTALHHAENFDALFATLPIDQIITTPDPANSSKSEAEKKEIALCKMESFYPLLLQNQYGVVGIEFEILNK